MNGAEPRKLNCWESLGCGRGPGSLDPCVVATDSAGNGVNGGTNGGRSCWAVVGTVSGGEELAPCAQGTSCLTCDFFRLVKSEEGPSFQFLKLAKGVSDLQELQETIGRVESLMAIHERMRTDFDLRTTIREITEEARKLTGAQRSLVLLVRGKPPALHGEFVLKGELKRVKIDFHESSAVGYAAVHNHMVNLKNIYGALHSSIGPVFNRAFDKQCDCRTHSFLAAPICDAQERVIGVITAANARKGFFSSDDEWFVEKYATEVALAV